MDWIDRSDLGYILFNQNVECWYRVKYHYRICATIPLKIEIQVSQIQPVEGNPPMCINTLNERIEFANKFAAYNVWNLIDIPPTNVGDTYDYWYFSAISCWTTLSYDCPVLYEENYVKTIDIPCVTNGCCGQQYQAKLLDAYRNMKLTPIGNLTGSGSCNYSHLPDLSQYPPINPARPIPPCENICESISHIGDVGDCCGSNNFRIGSVENNIYSKNEKYLINLSNDYSSLSIDMQTNMSVNIELKIINLMGNNIYDLRFENTSLLSKKIIDISNLKNGVYILNIIENNEIKKVQKFIINK